MPEDVVGQVLSKQHYMHRIHQIRTEQMEKTKKEKKEKKHLLVTKLSSHYWLLDHQYEFLAPLEEVQKSLCTTPGVSVGISVHVYV